MDRTVLAQIESYARAGKPQLHGIGIVRHGSLVLEWYHRGFGPTSYHSVNSVTKSIVSALVGILLRDGAFASLDQPMAGFFPDHEDVMRDPRAWDITLRHLLTMTSGFVVGEGPSYLDFSTHPRLVRSVLGRPLAHEPGSVFQYDDLSAHLISALVTRAAGMSTAAFARTALFGPLGIWAGEGRRTSTPEEGMSHTFHPLGTWGEEPDDFLWKADLQGIHIGGFGLHLTLREMATFGYLYLHEGCWDGRQIVPQDYVRASVQPHSAGGHPECVPYGYLWWVTREVGYPAFFAAGFGSQYIYVVPALDLVVVMAAASEDEPDYQLHREIVGRFVVPAVTDA